MKKLFRFHRGLLSDSLETCIVVNELEDIKKHIFDAWGEPLDDLKNIRIDKTKITDKRLPKEWNSAEYAVIADFGGYTKQCIGFTNFF